MDELPPLPHDLNDPQPFLPGIDLPWWAWLLIGLGVLAFFALIVFLLRRKKAAAKPEIPPFYQNCKLRLDALRSTLADRPLSEISTEASLALRKYLSDTLSEPALFETHEELLLREDALEDLPQGARERLEPLLDTLAEYKYGPPARTNHSPRNSSMIASKRSGESNRLNPDRLHDRVSQTLRLCRTGLALDAAHGSSPLPAGPEDGKRGLDRLLLALDSRLRGSTPLFRPGSIAATLFAFALIMGILGLARPQWRNDYTARTASGIDILIALDVSFSMEIPDFYPKDDRRLPPKRRIDAAKEVINAFIEQRPDDRIGLVAFAGRPYAVSPITLDHDWLRLNLSRLQLGDITEQGTAIGSAIAAAGTRLTKRDAKSKILVLVTDGANNSGKLDPIEAARHAATLGIRTYTVAIGTEEGRVSRMRQTIQQQEFDETTLREIAKLTKGEFFRAKTTSSLRKTFESINDLEKSEIKSRTVVETDELFIWFASLSTILCFLGLTITGLNPPPMP